jgi:hypothetical protein
LGFALYLVVVLVIAGIGAAFGRRMAAHRAHLVPLRWEPREAPPDRS